MAIKHQDWDGSKQVSKTKFLPEDDLQALRLEYDRYLVQRITSTHPHLTFKKYLAGKRLWDLCESFDIARFNLDEYNDCRLNGTISYTGSLKNEYLYAN